MVDIDLVRQGQLYKMTIDEQVDNLKRRGKFIISELCTALKLMAHS